MPKKMSKRTIIVPYGLKSILDSVAIAVMQEQPDNVAAFIAGYCADVLSFKIQNDIKDPKDAVLTFAKIREQGLLEMSPSATDEERTYEQLLSDSAADEMWLREVVDEALEIPDEPQISKSDRASSHNDPSCESVPVWDDELLQRAPSRTDAGQIPQVMDISLSIDSLLGEEASSNSINANIPSREASVTQPALIPDVELLHRAPSDGQVEDPIIMEYVAFHRVKEVSEQLSPQCSSNRLPKQDTIKPSLDEEYEMPSSSPNKVSSDDSVRTHISPRQSPQSPITADHVPSPPKGAPSARSKRSAHRLKCFKSVDNLHSKAVIDQVASLKVSQSYYEPKSAKRATVSSEELHFSGSSVSPPSSSRQSTERLLTRQKSTTCSGLKSSSEKALLTEQGKDPLLLEGLSHLSDDTTPSEEESLTKPAIVPDGELLQRAPSDEHIVEDPITEYMEYVTSHTVKEASEQLSPKCSSDRLPKQADACTESEEKQTDQVSPGLNRVPSETMVTHLTLIRGSCSFITLSHQHEAALNTRLLDDECEMPPSPLTRVSSDELVRTDIYPRQSSPQSRLIADHVPSPPKGAPTARSKRSAHRLKCFKSVDNLRSKAVIDQVASLKVSQSYSEPKSVKRATVPSEEQHFSGSSVSPPSTSQRHLSASSSMTCVMSAAVEEGRCCFPPIGKKVSLTTSLMPGKEGKASFKTPSDRMLKKSPKRTDSSCEKTSGTVKFPPLDGSSSQRSATHQPVSSCPVTEEREKIWTLYHLPHRSEEGVLTTEVLSQPQYRNGAIIKAFGPGHVLLAERPVNNSPALGSRSQTDPVRIRGRVYRASAVVSGEMPTGFGRDHIVIRPPPPSTDVDPNNEQDNFGQEETNP